MPERSKRLRVMAGPNGSGKSSIFKEITDNYRTGPFINADEIERELESAGELDLKLRYGLHLNAQAFKRFMNCKGRSWIEKAGTEGNKISLSLARGKLLVGGKPSAYDAALAADFVRHELLKQGLTFTFETVMSHPSKVEFLREAQAAGYKNYLYFICTTDPAINIQRIAQRVKQGGHDVPRDKIIKRYRESLEILPLIIPLCYRVYLFDNSSAVRTAMPIAEINNHGALIIHNLKTPWWVDEYVIRRLY
jgi:predicted ABC-type ATPase